MSDWFFPYTDGYTGPYYSDGKFQSSVANGKTKPRGKLGEFSRDHDTAYNLCQGDSRCNDEADREYYRRTRDEPWASVPFVPRLIGMLPLAAHNPLGLLEEIFLNEKPKKHKNKKTNKNHKMALDPSIVDSHNARNNRGTDNAPKKVVKETRVPDEEVAYAPVQEAQINETVYLPFDDGYCPVGFDIPQNSVAQLNSAEGVYNAVGRTNFRVRRFRKSKY